MDDKKNHCNARKGHNPSDCGHYEPAEGTCHCRAAHEEAEKAVKHE